MSVYCPDDPPEPEAREDMAACPAAVAASLVRFRSASEDDGRHEHGRQTVTRAMQTRTSFLLFLDLGYDFLYLGYIQNLGKKDSLRNIA
jgi:hypothetical protein